MTSTQATPGQARYALAVLLLAYILSFVDRNVMAVLIGPIREQFSISDFQYSLLHGFAFSMFYIVLGLPIARLADRHNRKWIITIGVFCWSVMTCLCGAARSFAMLFLARVGVGVGEAALSPSAFSLLSDLFPPDKLARAIAVYSLGITIGGGLAYIVGAAVYQYFAAGGDIVLPLFGMVSPWQMTFIVVGAPGFLIVVLLAFLKEPKRQQAVDAVAPDTSLAEVWQQLKDHKQAYFSLMAAMGVLSLLGYGTMAWYPEFLIRTFGMERGDAGGQFGMIFLIAGSLGALAGGWSVQPLTERGYKDAPLRIILTVACLWLVPACLGPMAPSAEWAVIAACPIVFFLNAHYGVAIAGLQFITPNHMRAQISALMLFVTNFFGLALGPTAVALLTDFVFGDDQALRYSLLVLPLLVCPTAAILLVMGLKHYRRALDAV
ncbi:MAG: MFS transporter [Halioglobus sp.]